MQALHALSRLWRTPPPQYEHQDTLLQQALTSIRTILTDTVAASEFASTSFSLEITSSKESLWSLHHTARERNASRPDIPRVNGDALYRIASITKTFTVLAILQQHKAGNLHLDDTVDQYIQELGHVSDGGIPWKDITLRSLASQLSGIPRDCKLDDDDDDIPPDQFHCSMLKGMVTDSFSSRSGRRHQYRQTPIRCPFRHGFTPCVKKRPDQV